MLLAWDAPDLDSTELDDVVRPLVDARLTYFCTYGRNCEALHDAAERAYVKKESKSDCPLDFFTMTTWHKNESLEEAVRFFKLLAIPSEPNVFAEFDRFAVAVGNPQWRKVIERVLVANERSVS